MIMMMTVIIMMIDHDDDDNAAAALAPARKPLLPISLVGSTPQYSSLQKR